MDDKALQIVRKRYFMDDEQSWSDLAVRVGRIVAARTIDPGIYTTLFIEMIDNQEFIPGGRILRNVGRSRGSIFNCYHLPIGDSREEIGECFKNSFILWGEGGGVGINFSTIRPDGAAIMGVGGEASGPVSFMRALDAIAETVESGGQRRAASLGLLEVWHPEIHRFIRSKHQNGEISYFNISVGVINEFIEAVQKDDSWDLKWQNQTWSTVSAVELWNEIVSGMLHNGEPGLLNMTNLRNNNSYYFAPISGVNPCGEATLEENGVCDLGSLVLPKFVSNGRVQWARMEEVIHHAVRFLDTCIDLNNYSLNRIRQTAQRGRRIGLGYMGLADMLFDLHIKYGSRDALDFEERLAKFFRNVSYQASIKLATEKGSFPAYDPFNYCKSKFIRTLPPSLRQDIRNHGMRNVTVNAIAPTGTISLVAGTTSSIEPLTYKSYRREDRVGDRIYIHPIFAECLRENKPLPDWFVDSRDLEPIHHIETQGIIQKYTDGAVSKTIALPSDFDDAEALGNLLLESIFDLKGVTVYRDASREKQILYPLEEKETRKWLDAADITADMESVACATGTCDL